MILTYASHTYLMNISNINLESFERQKFAHGIIYEEDDLTFSFVSLFVPLKLFDLSKPTSYMKTVELYDNHNTSQSVKPERIKHSIPEWIKKHFFKITFLTVFGFQKAFIFSRFVEYMKKFDFFRENKIFNFNFKLLSMSRWW